MKRLITVMFFWVAPLLVGVTIGAWFRYQPEQTLLSVPDGYHVEFCQGGGFNLKVAGSRGSIECLGNPCHAGAWIYDAEGRAVSGMVPGFKSESPCVARKAAE